MEVMVRILHTYHYNNKMNRKYNKNIIYLCLFECFLSMVFQRGIFILFLISLGFTNVKIGLLQSVLFFTIFLSEIPTGVIGDKIGRKNTLIIGVLLNIISLWIMVYYKNFTMILFSFIFEGMAMAFFSGTSSALFYESLKLSGKEEKYLKYNGNLSTLASIIMGIAIVLGPFLREISWQFVYTCSLVAVLCSGIFLIFVYDNKEDYVDTSIAEKDSFSIGILKFLKENRRSRLELFIIGTAIIEATAAYYYILAQPLLDSQNFSLKKIGLLYGSLQIISGLMYKLAIKINSKYTLKKISIYSTIMSIVGFLIILFDKSLLTLVTLLVITAISDIMYISKDNYIQKSLPSKFRGSLLSIVSFVTSLITGIIYLVFGQLGDVLPFNWSMSCLVIPNIIALILLKNYFKQNKNQTKKESNVYI